MYRSVTEKLTIIYDDMYKVDTTLDDAEVYVNAVQLQYKPHKAIMISL